MPDRTYHVDILASRSRRIYVGVTRDLRRRIRHWPRWRKDRLVESANPGWEDLSAQGGRDGVDGSLPADGKGG